MNVKYILAIALASVSLVANAQYKVFTNSNQIKEIMNNSTCEDNLSLCRQISTFEVIARSVACTNYLNTIQNKPHKKMEEDISVLMKRINDWKIFEDKSLRRSVDENAALIDYFENMYVKYLDKIPVPKMIEFCSIKDIIKEQKEPEKYGVIMKHKNNQ